VSRILRERIVASVLIRFLVCVPYRTILSSIRLGLPVASLLEPAPAFYARVVTIKKFTEPEPFSAYENA
jgi:hypothetical protein